MLFVHLMPCFRKGIRMLQLAQCRLPYQKAAKDNLYKKVSQVLHIDREDIKRLIIVKKSIDARKKPQIFVTYTVHIDVVQEEKVWKKNKTNEKLTQVKESPSLWKVIKKAEKKENIVVVGAGPAGLFCAYYLSLCGFRPVLVERGAPMEERVKDVRKFWQEEVLNGESNVSFGEGGAGTFSDGKLNTGVKDRTGRKQFVLESFVRFGAGEDILYDSHPHIGTDVLRHVIVAMRKEMERQGCVFFFHTKFTDMHWTEGCLKEITICQGNEKRRIACDRLVLAIGHSARDTFTMLYEKGMNITQKPFAIGARVEHRQKDIDMAQYGLVDKKLPASPYKLTGKTSEGRGVYSFCMCPGGYVVNASSEQGGLVVNGMSDVKRDSGYANSAIVVTVEPKDFESEHPLAGVTFQRKYEQQMFKLCRGKIPVQRYEDFVHNKTTLSCGKVEPCVKGKWQFANLRRALPKVIINGMIEGIRQFAHRIDGFDDGDTLLLGLESRTSSPIRMERSEEFESLTWSHVYPCGEGAGYAGGIMSAAIDGLRIAMEIQKKLQNGD